MIEDAICDLCEDAGANVYLPARKDETYHDGDLAWHEDCAYYRRANPSNEHEWRSMVNRIRDGRAIDPDAWMRQ